LSLIINFLPSLSVWLLKSSTSLQAMIIDLLRGETTHEDILKAIPAWLPKKIFEKLKRGSHK
jgi:hypothetical protein